MGFTRWTAFWLGLGGALVTLFGWGTDGVPVLYPRLGLAAMISALLIWGLGEWLGPFHPAWSRLAQAGKVLLVAAAMATVGVAGYAVAWYLPGNLPGL